MPGDPATKAHASDKRSLLDHESAIATTKPSVHHFAEGQEFGGGRNGGEDASGNVLSAELVPLSGRVKIVCVAKPCVLFNSAEEAR